MVSRTFLPPARRSGSGADWSSRTRVILTCHSHRVLPLIVDTVVRPLVLAIFQICLKEHPLAILLITAAIRLPSLHLGCSDDIRFYFGCNAPLGIVHTPETYMS